MLGLVNMIRKTADGDSSAIEIMTQYTTGQITRRHVLALLDLRNYGQLLRSLHAAQLRHPVVPDDERRKMANEMVRGIRGKAIRLVIPDSGVLISLAQGGLLDLLVALRSHVSIVLTDVVEYEVTKRVDFEDTRVIRAFLAKNQRRVQIDATSFGRLQDSIRRHPDLQLPEDAGELFIYSYINSVAGPHPGTATLVLFEDDWFMSHSFVRRGSTHVVSTIAFLEGLRRLVPESFRAAALRRITTGRPEHRSRTYRGKSH